MDTPRIAVIIGSTREGRFSEHAAHWIDTLAQDRTDLTLTRIDLRDHPLPHLEAAGNPSYMNGNYPDPRTQQFADTIRGFDGYIMITPEYNHSTSSVLKSALDHIFGEFANKPVAFIGYGSVGGARAVEHLRLIAIEHQMAPIRNAVHIMAPWNLREADGSLKAGALDSYTHAGTGMLEQLVWWARALKTARG